MRMRIYISNEEDRLTMISILAKNGYTVKIDREKLDGAKNYTYFIEYWKEE